MLGRRCLNLRGWGSGEPGLASLPPLCVVLLDLWVGEGSCSELAVGSWGVPAGPGVEGEGYRWLGAGSGRGQGEEGTGSAVPA